MSQIIRTGPSTADGRGETVAERDRDRHHPRMRIAIVGAAGSYHVWKWVHAFRQLGHDLVVFNTRAPAAEPLGVPTEELHLEPHPPGALARYRHYGRVGLALRRRLRAGGFDAVNVQWVDSTPYTLGLRSLDNLVVTPWGRDVIPPGGDRGPRRWLKRALLDRARAITVSSDFLGEHVRGYLSRPVPVHRIPFGIDLGLYSPGDEPPARSGVVFGIAKPLQAIYGHRVLIEAFARLREGLPTSRLDIAGDGPDRDELETLVRERGLQGAVVFRGRIPPASMPGFYRMIDVFVMPSLIPTESFGVAAIEASAMRIPVIASRAGGIPEAVVDGETGLLVAPGNTADLAAAMEALAASADRRRELGAAGRDRVEREFDLLRVNAPAFVNVLAAAGR